jgi:hypothetical protein
MFCADEDRDLKTTPISNISTMTVPSSSLQNSVELTNIQETNIIEKEGG